MITWYVASPARVSTLHNCCGQGQREEVSFSFSKEKNCQGQRDSTWAKGLALHTKDWFKYLACRQSSASGPYFIESALNSHVHASSTIIRSLY